jgi:outer membrane murein-binding lipoprotein Lpp
MNATKVIAAGVAAVLLSAGVASPLSAQKTKPDTVKGGVAPGTNVAALTAAVDELTKALAALRSRVQALESEAGKVDESKGTLKMGQKFQAPFSILDENGKVIFSVSDDPYSVGFRGRVHIAPGSGGNYNIWIHNASGTLAATMGESRAGAGFFSALMNGKDAVTMTGEGFGVENAAGKSLAHMGLDPANKTRARIVLRGPLYLTDEAGNTVVDAGSPKVGLGAVRAYPNADCRASALPACIKGN